MTTHTVTDHPVRNDLPGQEASEGAGLARPSRAWAVAGLVAGVAGIGTMVSSSAVSAVYDPKLAGDSAKVADRLTEQVPAMFAFHGFTVVSAVLLVVFAAGVLRRLRSAASDSIAPTVAFSGLLGTAIVLVLGSGLNTEFIFAFLDDEVHVDPANAALYNHWIGTIPWLWTLVGLSGLSLFVVARLGGLPRWLGLVGLVGGGLTLLLGMSPFQYMAGMTGPVGLVIVSLGFLAGDKAFRGRV